MWSKRVLSPQVVQQHVLKHQDETLSDMIEGSDLVVQLAERCLGSHFPVHAEGLARCRVDALHFDSKGLDKPLPFWPNGPCCIDRLKLNPNEVANFAVSNRDQAVIDVTTRHRNLG